MDCSTLNNVYMWYKYDESNKVWLEGNKVHFPDGTVLNENHSETKDGWFWSDVPPYEELLNIEE